MADNLSKFMAGTRQIESGGNYRALGPVTRYGRASGAYQFIDATWGGYKGYRRAADAPKSVQDAKARALMGSYYARYKDWGLVSVAWHAGPGNADRVRRDPGYIDTLNDGNLDTEAYVKRVLAAAGLKRSSGRGSRGGDGDDRGRRSGRPRRPPWKVPANTVDGEGRLTVDVDRLHGLAREMTGHLAVLESVRRRSADVLDELALDDRGDARRIRDALDTALGEHGVTRARDAMVRDIGYVVEARERALGADRTDRDHRRVVERLIASLAPGSATVATRRKVRGLLRGLYEPARSSGGGSGGGGGGSSRGLVKPLPYRLTSTSEFGVRDAEGAPANNGVRYHAGKDWFAPGGTEVRSPIAGKVVEVRASKGNTGQVFGGTVKVQGSDGKVWVFRHVDPKGVSVGERVDAGDRIATVTRWAGGPSHAHIEHWKTLGGGYDYENMLDPMASLRRFT